MPPTIKTVTLGCKVNQYETEFVRQGLLDVGYRDAVADQPANLCVVNTCTVTNEGDSKSRQLIRRIARENPGADVIVMGCYATRAPEQVADLPGVTEVVTDKRNLPNLLRRFGVVDVPRGVAQFGNRHRAYIKVQDGCYLRCTYCIIPLVRQPPFSRAAEEIIEEAQQLVHNGYREIVLTGVHLGHYGVDRNRSRAREHWVRLAHLVDRLTKLQGEYRIRLSSIEATEVTPELIAVVADHPDRVCPHFHVCLQSGSDRVLRQMRRRWPVSMIIDRCAMLKARLEHPALTTDAIVGFPGETDDDFAATCQVVQQIGFSKVHVFPFSPRSGTPAATMTDQVDGRTKKSRGAELGRIADRLRQDYTQRLDGMKLSVLVESVAKNDEDTLIGTADRYVPVRIPNGGVPLGTLLDCRVAADHQQRLCAVS